MDEMGIKIFTPKYSITFTYNQVKKRGTLCFYLYLKKKKKVVKKSSDSFFQEKMTVVTS